MRQVEEGRRRERLEVEKRVEEVAEWGQRIREAKEGWLRCEDEEELEVLEQAERRRQECLEING